MATRVLTCQCGCNTTFTQDGVGRVRKYLNAAHKSNANNNRTRELVKRGRSVKEAVLFAHVCDNLQTADIAAWFPDLTRAQWEVIYAIQASGLGYAVFAETLSEMAAW